MLKAVPQKSATRPRGGKGATTIPFARRRASDTWRASGKSGVCQTTLLRTMILWDIFERLRCYRARFARPVERLSLLFPILLMPKGGLEPPRVASHAPQTCASTSSATSAEKNHLSSLLALTYQRPLPATKSAAYFCGACGLPAGAGCTFAAGAGAAVLAGAVAAAFVLAGAALVFVAGASPVAGGRAGLAAGAAGVACGCGASSPCKTERDPAIKGNASASAASIKAAAAPIVILARSVCVPRGPKAALETLLEKSAPASALPGCKSTATTSTMHASIKIAYKT